MRTYLTEKTVYLFDYIMTALPYIGKMAINETREITDGLLFKIDRKRNETFDIKTEIEDILNRISFKGEIVYKKYTLINYNTLTIYIPKKGITTEQKVMMKIYGAVPYED